MFKRLQNDIMARLQKNAIMTLGEQFGYELVFAIRDEINAAKTSRELTEIENRYNAIIERMK